MVSLTSQACLRTVVTADWFNLVCSSMHSDQIYAGKLQVRPGQVGSRQLSFPPVGKVIKAMEKAQVQALGDTLSGTEGCIGSQVEIRPMDVVPTPSLAAADSDGRHQVPGCTVLES